MKKMNRRNRYRKSSFGLPKPVIEDLVTLARKACLNQICLQRNLTYEGRKVGRVNINVLGHRVILHWLLHYPHGVEIRRYHIDFDMWLSNVTINRFCAHTLAEVKLMNRLTRMGLYVAKLQKKINNNLTK